MLFPVLRRVKGSTTLGRSGISSVPLLTPLIIPLTIPSWLFSTSTFPYLTKIMGSPVSWQRGIPPFSAASTLSKMALRLRRAVSSSSKSYAVLSAFLTSSGSFITASLNKRHTVSSTIFCLIIGSVYKNSVI
ncbi:MAG: hypothetical protein BWY74_04231 [Firmicutes bacterium ADurb.Bin419]|nr:MAG: hypothetical protein BWY74_04231 [Firmicutes bacterium ADurb.Bin419]